MIISTIKKLFKYGFISFKKNFRFSQMVLRVRKCPYCDSIDLVIRIDMQSEEKWVQCLVCDARGPKDFRAVDAVKKWGVVAYGSKQMAKLEK